MSLFLIHLNVFNAIPANQSAFLNCSHQCGVNSLNLVLLKGSEARHLAAQVGVDEHLRWTEETQKPGRLHSKGNRDVCVQCFHTRQHKIKAFSSRCGQQTLSGPPTSSIPAVPTLCAASRLWTKPISVRYFIPDATPVNMSMSCITLSWPSCFCADRRTEREQRKMRARLREQSSDAVIQKVKKALAWSNNVLTGHNLFIWRKETNSH